MRSLRLQKPEQFISDMKTLFDGLTWEQISDDTSGVIQARFTSCFRLAASSCAMQRVSCALHHR